MTLRHWLSGLSSRLTSKARSRCRTRKSTATAAAAEVLEQRQVPAAALKATLTAGALTIEGTNKEDTIIVRQVNDQISVNGLRIGAGGTQVNAVAVGQVQRIIVNSLGGKDTIRFDSAGAGGVQDIQISALINGGAGNDTITAGAGDDTITGDLGNDTINAGLGTNLLVESGNVHFQLTNTRLTGVGTDTLTGIAQARLTGGTGNNQLDASQFSGSVTLDGGAGNDTLRGGGANDSLIGSAGNDTIVANAGNDTLEGGTGNDNVQGGAGDDQFVFRGSTSLGADVIAVGDNQGVNTLDFSGFGVKLTRLDLGQTTSQTVALSGTTALLKLTFGSADAIDQVVGTRFDDVVFGNDLNNTLTGGDGNDELAGNGGDDLLDGGAGDDLLDGHAGRDTLRGGDQDDELFGDESMDVLDGGSGLNMINGQSPIIGFAVEQILTVLNTGRVDVLQVLDFIVSNGLGQDLPVVGETVGAVLDVVNKLRTVFERNIEGTRSEVESLFRSLESVGFRLEYFSEQADGNGDLLRITYDRTFNTDRARFSVTGATGFDYFDREVNGRLGGRLTAQSPTVRVQVTFGVDLVNNVPTFFVSDNSSVSFDDLTASARVDGEMAMRFLAGVHVAGTLSVDLDGRLSLQDSDSDHKLRVSDLSQTSSIRGDLDGSITLDVDMNTDLPVLRDIEWSGEWVANLVDGAVNIGAPTLHLPSADSVLQAILTSFVDMQNNFEFLGPIADILNEPLDVINRTIGELTGVGDRLGWLTENVTAVRDSLRELGIEIIDVNANTVMQLINGERVDLIRFHAGDSGTLWSEHGEFLVAVAPITGFLNVVVNGTIHAEIGWDYEVGFGVDTTGVWIDPRTHLGLYGGVRAGVATELNFLGIAALELEAGVGVQLFAGLGLRDPYAPDGRIYMDEIFRGVGVDGRSLTDAIFDVIKVDMRLEAQGYVRGELELPWPLPNITLFDESFNLGAIIDSHEEAQQTESLRRIPLPGQADRIMPATLRPDGTLVLDGTADPDYVGLTRRDGIVDVRWSGYRNAQFANVRQVTFNGNGDDDSLTVDRAFDLPILANGGEGDDFLTGGSADDTLNGGTGNDELRGQGGNDQVDGGDGNDVSDGGNGNDVIHGGHGRDLLQGGAGDDRVNGQDGVDMIEGGSGNDTLTGGRDFDALYGGSGDDQLDGNDDADNLTGDDGKDTIRGGAGGDAIHAGLGDDQVFGGDGDDLILGDEGDDQLLGESGEDIVMGSDGDDSINGGRGNDFLRGEMGDDQVTGSVTADSVIDEADVDTVFGGAGNDTLRGGRGTDYLNGEEGGDDLNGEEGKDILLLDLTSTIDATEDTLAGGVDADSLWISPAYLQTNEIAAEAQAVLSNVFRVMDDDGDPPALNLEEAGRLTRDAATHGTGDNIIRLTQMGLDDFLVEQYDPANNALIASLSFSLTGGTDTDLETITIAGMDGNDVIEVSANTTRDVLLDGGEGDDTLVGGSGRDVLRGQAGNDSLVGGENDDEMHGGDGHDTLEGETGTDRLYGNQGNDSLNGGQGHDFQVGGDGDDFITAGEGSLGDVIDGGRGYDTLIGSNGIDLIRGGDESGPRDPDDATSPRGDWIEGLDLSDFLDGGLGDDTITGGRGADILIGDGGNDFLVAGSTESETLRSPAEWLVEEQQVRADLAKLNEDITRLTTEVNRLLAIPVEQRTNDDISLLAQLAQEELDLRTLEDQLTEVKQELNRERGAILVEELSKSGITLNYQSVNQDMVVGGDGNDTLTGSALQDLLIGSEGDDEFRHSSGRDQVVGGNGHDTYLLDATDADDQITIRGVPDGTSNLAFDVELVTNSVLMTSHISLAPDIEALGVRGLGGNDTMTASLGTNALKDIRFEGGNGNDKIDVSGIESKATLIGGSGNDTLIGGKSGDSLDGGAGNDSLDGGNDRDVLDGGAGDDALQGGAENDNLNGGSGDDQLSGGLGNDVISGGMGRDTMFGGDGNDVLDGGGDDDTLSGDDGIDKLYGGAGNDSLDGGLSNDELYGDAGSDLLDGGIGNDTLGGGDGDDQLQGGVGDGQDSLSGGFGNDSLVGGAGADILLGGGGADTLRGDAGNDDLKGGTGADLLDGGVGQDTLAANGTTETSSDDSDAVGNDPVTDQLHYSEGLDSYDGHGTATTQLVYDAVRFGYSEHMDLFATGILIHRGTTLQRFVPFGNLTWINSINVQAPTSYYSTSARAMLPTTMTQAGGLGYHPQLWGVFSGEGLLNGTAIERRIFEELASPEGGVLVFLAPGSTLDVTYHFDGALESNLEIYNFDWLTSQKTWLGLFNSSTGSGVFTHRNDTGRVQAILFKTSFRNNEGFWLTSASAYFNHSSNSVNIGFEDSNDYDWNEPALTVVRRLTEGESPR